MQAADCMTHTRRVASFCKLPPKYPRGQKWTAEDNTHYTPITRDILDGATHELTSDDIKQDINWITKSTCSVTSNVDRAIINTKAAMTFGQHNNAPILLWKRQLHQELRLCIQAILYYEEARPKPFAYFVQGSPGQVFDNVHGNVYFGVANSSACTMHGLASDDPKDK